MTHVTSISSASALLVAGHDRGADAPVPLALHEADAGVADLRDPRRRRVGGGVVDHEDAVDELRDPGERLADQVLLVVRGDDDRDALFVDHARDVTADGMLAA